MQRVLIPLLQLHSRAKLWYVDSSRITTTKLADRVERGTRQFLRGDKLCILLITTILLNKWACLYQRHSISW